MTNDPASPSEPSLLAVDVGLRTGLALYGADGKLVWYRATSFGNRERHDAAEAILAGLWGVLEMGWLRRIPAALGCRVPPYEREP